MRINKSLLMISLLLISILAISAASAADDMVDADIDVASSEISEVSVDDVQATDKNVLSDADEVSVVTQNTPYNENATIDISVNGTLADDSTIKLFIDGEDKGDLNLSAEGKASYVIPASTLDVGKYFIEAVVHNGTSSFGGRSTLNITKVTPIVSVSDVTVKSGDYITIPFNVTDDKGKAIPGDVIVTIVWENDVISKHIKLNDNSSAGFNIADIIGIFGGNSTGNGTGTGIGDLFNRNGTNGTGNGTGIGDLFNRNGTNGTGNGTGIGDLFNRNGTNGTGNGTGIPGIGGNSTGNGTGNGTGDFDIASILAMLMGGGNNTGAKFAYVFEKGVYNVSVEYLSNRNYNGAINDTAKLTITPLEDVLINATIETAKNMSDNTTVSILLTDGYEKPIAGGEINVFLNGENKGKVTANEEGKASITFSNLLKGDYELLLNYKETNKTFDFFVNVERMGTVIEYEDMNTTSVNEKVDGRIGEDFQVTLKDNEGKALANRFVQIGFNGKIYNRTTDDKGQTKLQINLFYTGDYTFAVCYLGDDAYNASFIVAKIKVSKQTPKITTKDATYKADAKTKNIKVTLKSAKDNAIKDKKISVTVNGKTYTAKTDEKGVATVKVSLSKKGTYSFTAKYAGDSGYTQVSTKGILTLK